MTNLQAAIGVAQMERVDVFIDAKQRIAEFYNSCLSKYLGIITPPRAEWAYNSYWLYTFVIDSSFGVSRDELMKKLLLNGVETRPVFYPLHEMPPYTKYASGKYSVTNFVSLNGISLPSFASMTNESLQSIVRSLETVFEIRNLVKEL